MNGNFLAVTSLENWNWGETAVFAVFVLIAVLTMRSVVERERAIVFGKGQQARDAAYEARWRSNSLTTV